MARPIPLLSLWQPWASLMVLPHPDRPGEVAKPVETRGWSTGYRGPVLIHAAKSLAAVPARQRLTLGEWEVERDRSGLLLRGPVAWPYRLPLGRVLAVANLVDVQPSAAFPGQVPDDILPLGDFTPGRFGWVFTEVRRLPDPIACPGHQGLRAPTQAVIEQALAAVTDRVAPRQLIARTPAASLLDEAADA